jgi:hypothetical protein
MERSLTEIKTAEAATSRAPTLGELLATYAPLQRHFLMRLLHLDALRRAATEEVEVDQWDRQLIDRSLFAAYRDCEDAGVALEARLIMRA